LLLAERAKKYITSCLNKILKLLGTKKDIPAEKDCLTPIPNPYVVLITSHFSHAILITLELLQDCELLPKPNS